VTFPQGDNLASILAIQYIMDNVGRGRWVIVLNQEGESDTSMWSYMQSAMAWEVGVVGAVIAGYVRDLDETHEKLGKEFGLYGWGGSPVKPECTPNGVIGEPVEINGVSIRAGDLIVGDSDGVVCIARDEVEHTIERCRQAIIDDVNRLQHVREGRGPIEVMELEELLKGNVDWEE
jgi:4-hydroxy-4-methyl-2-oxoglutarate aldolase